MLILVFLTWMHTNGFAQIQAGIATFFQGKKAALSLTFDDGLQEHYTLLRPELNHRKLRATFAIIGSKIGGMMSSSQDKAMGIKGTPCMTWDMVRQLAADGHEIGSHGWEHKNVTKLSAEHLQREVRLNDSIIRLHTGDFPKSYFYPGNKKDSSSVSFCERGRVGSRTYQTSIGSKRDISWLRKWLHELIENGEWGIGMTHGIATGYDHFTNPQVLWTFLDEIVTLQDYLWVAPFCEVAAYVREKDNISLSVSYKKQKVIITPYCPLSPDLFHQPLTLILNTTAVTDAHQGSASLHIYQSEGSTMIDFLPDGGDIIINLGQHTDELQCPNTY